MRVPKGLTREEMLGPQAITCAKCGSAGRAYNGGTYCPKCSPAWVDSFLAFLHRQWTAGKR